LLPLLELIGNRPVWSVNTLPSISTIFIDTKFAQTSS
jgi:hypothetical protein